MEMMDIEKLKPHKQNTYFFDDMDGEPWVAFLKSVETSGIIEPIIATQDLIIVSGHQRIRAAKKLGIEKVAVEVRVFESDDEVLKQLIETNIRQRGVGNTNPVKFGFCIKELERIYGIKQGNNQHTQEDANNVRKQDQKTQKDLADEIGVDVKTLQNAKRLAELPEEIQQMVMDGKVTASTASRVIARMSPEEQKKFYEEFADKDKVSSRDVEYYKKRVAEQQKKINELRSNKTSNSVTKIRALKEIMLEQIDRLEKGENNSLSDELKQVGIKDIPFPSSGYWLWHYCNEAIQQACVYADGHAKGSICDEDFRNIIWDHIIKMHMILAHIDDNYNESFRDNMEAADI